MDKIKNGTYQGYVWMSNAEKPEIIQGEFDKSLDPLFNPFIIEGFLYNESDGISYSIKYVDGNYLIIETKVDEEKYFESKEEFYANPKLQEQGIKKLKFYREWVAVKDELCAGNMEVLQPGKLVFVGFELK